MITEKEFLLQGIEWGISADNPDFINLAKATIDQIEWLEVKTILDYGAGTGVYAEQARQKGYDVKAFDIWESHREYMRDRFPELKQTENPVTADLMILIEVAEHMTDKEVTDLLNSISPRYIIFSACNASTPKDEYWGHINIKEQWHDFLKTFGYEVVKKLNHPTDHTFLYQLNSNIENKRY